LFNKCKFDTMKFFALISKVLLLVVYGMSAGKTLATDDKTEICYQNVWACLKTASKTEPPTGNERIEQNQRIMVRYWDEYKVPDEIFTTGTIATKDRIIMISDDLEYYQDEKDVIMINKKTQSIVHTQSSLFYMDSQHERRRLIEELQDTVMAYVSGKTMTEYKSNGKSIQKLELDIEEKMQKTFKVKKLVYHYDPGKKEVIKTELYFDESYKIKAKITWFLDDEISFDKDILKKPVKKQVFTSDGKLKEKYNNYTYIDNQESSKN